MCNDCVKWENVSCQLVTELNIKTYSHVPAIYSHQGRSLLVISCSEEIIPSYFLFKRDRYCLLSGTDNSEYYFTKINMS